MASYTCTNNSCLNNNCSCDGANISGGCSGGGACEGTGTSCDCNKSSYAFTGTCQSTSGCGCTNECGGSCASTPITSSNAALLVFIAIVLLLITIL